MQNLVIVESPTKSRTLQKFLGSKYKVEASMGHIRDLPKGELGVDTEGNFEPKYVIPRDKTKRVNELKKTAQDVKILWLATDPDREGEAIAWHLAHILTTDSKKLKAGEKNRKPNIEREVKRVVFHEITPEAVKEAFENPRTIDLRLVDAQQARRVLDRLVGYKLSPLLWKKVKSGLSAGRVQSVALRLIVEKEKEIEAFKSEEYWSIEAELKSKLNENASSFIATLIELNNKKLSVNNKDDADKHVLALKDAGYQVEKVVQKEVKKYPSPPFTTSTLQQTSSNKLGLTAKKTMMIAQNLYEHGIITYMRTDSFSLSDSSLLEIRSYIKDNFGLSYLPQAPKIYKTKSKVAQEAHEAIRPTKINFKVEDLKNMGGVTRDHLRLYELIWKRTLACQTSEAVLDQTTVEVSTSHQPSDFSHQTKNSLTAESEAVLTTDSSYLLRATGSVIKFDGFLKVYGVKGSGDEVEEGKEEKGQILPKVSQGEDLNLLNLLPEQHFTEPPARFNEASLIKKLEELGIGRPSTYAPIISTITDRFYVERKERRLFPTELGIVVTGFLMEHFPDVFDYSFTAQMENELDEIANGEREWKKTIGQFYNPFAEKISKTEESAQRVKIGGEIVDQKCPECGKNLVIKFGKFGKFLACTGFPDCKYTTSLEEKVDVKCPDCGGEVVVRKTRKGKPFYGCKNWPTCKYASWTKPKSGQTELNSKKQ